MTICIAALCAWTYDGTPDDMGFAVVAAADRMFTDSGLEIEYETGQGKWTTVGKRTIILVADSLPIQSELIRQLHLSTQSNDNISAHEAADIYSRLLIKYKRDEAEKLYLAPYGLDLESFAKSMHSDANALITDLASRVLDYSIPAEAIVCGVSEEGNATIYHVDNRGIVTSHTDVGFISIGSGHYHANAFLTSRKYWNRWPYKQAICAIYAAKTQAEKAPGVGKQADMFVITKLGIEMVVPHMRAALDAEYPIYQKALDKLEARLIDKVWKRVIKNSPEAQAVSPVEGENVVTLPKK